MEEQVISLSIPNFSTFTRVDSPERTIGGLPWKLMARTECSERTENEKCFSVFIYCNSESESPFWSCEAIVDFRFISHEPNIPYRGQKLTKKFDCGQLNIGFPSFMKWSEVIDSAKGYVRDNCVIVEAHITIQKVVGVREDPTFNFTLSQPGVCDGTLVVDGIQLHVNKGYLALYSPVFRAMFFSEFSEQDKKEIPIEDVKLDEFVELFNVVYPSHKAISAENVEFLLKLGDRFDIQFVMDKCEQFLVMSNDISMPKKLLWAGQYRLTKLYDACSKTFKRHEDFRVLKNSDERKLFTHATMEALFEKLLKLV